jgi:flagellin
MAMVVQHNMQAMNSSRMLGVTTGQQAKSTEKLSSGYKINRAADDAAGLTISEKMRKQINGLDRASTNAQDGVSAVQTAEGALTEVHSMLQRMNELAVQASNGTNSKSDRDAIQSEVNQLNTEIDRVAETTKFNETYLLKGDSSGTRDQIINAHDAGLKGTMANAGTATATFTADSSYVTKDSKVSIAGTEYTVTAASTGALAEANTTALNTAATTILDSATAKAGNITGDEALTLMANEMAKASGIGVDDASKVKVAATKEGVFTITTGTAKVNKDLSFNLHVGADSDMTNKIGVNVGAMNTANLGIKGLNVTDDTGISATYAIDSISDAIQKVSSQRSSLGAVQNRLEHTISNLDNIVENTTSAESRIRDTDMADEMVNYSKNNILASAGQSMLAQANQSTQGVLSLLK